MNERGIFMEALEQDTLAHRSAFLDEACAGDAALRQRVEALLASHEQAGSFLGISVPERLAEKLAVPDGAADPHGEPPGGACDGQSLALRLVATVDEPCGTERLGTLIGPYKLLQQIGEGGMGTVFMAEQTHPVQRKVALKVIKAGMDSQQVIARFEAERQALAMMDHVNIARVLDAGTVASGQWPVAREEKQDAGALATSHWPLATSERPYFVMELVHGVPITKYCDDNQLTPRQRLELFVPVCQAIQHAHQKGIIHRDIKPSNVMITLYDGKPVPKVIDFGVAKATEQRLTERTLFTQYGTMVGTLEYMSPEQAEMSGLGVDTRSDIYSLGVLLYELLTGNTPLSHKRVREAAYGEILRMIREEEPPKPSRRLSDSGEALASISAQRHMEPAKLTKLVRGELDWIVMKCLEKDRNRRYETANGFAADIQRYLSDEAVQACPPTRWYRFCKFARRNKAALGAAVLVAATLVIALVTLAISNMWVAHERDQKDEALKDRQEALNLSKINEESANQQRQKAQHNLKEALRVVDQMLTRVAEEKLAHVPQMEEVRRTLLLDALNFYEQFLKDNSTDPALRLEAGKAYQRVGGIQIHLGKPAEGEKGCHQAIGLLEKLAAEFPAEPSYRETLAESYNLLGFGVVPLGRYEESEAAHRRALALVEQLVTEDPQNEQRRHQKLEIQITLAGRARHFGRHREAEEFLRQSLAVQEELAGKPGGDRSRQFLPHHHLELAWVFRSTSRPREAEQAFGQAITLQKELVDKFPARPDFRHDLASMNHFLGDLLREKGQAQDAEKLYREAINLGTKLAREFPLVPGYHQVVAGHHLGLGLVLAANNHSEEAEQAYRQALTLAEKAVEMVPGQAGPRHELIEIHLCMGDFLHATDRNDAAEKSYRAAVELSRKLVSDFPTQQDCRQRLARANDSLGLLFKALPRPGEAEEHYRKALAFRQELVDSSPSSGTYRRELADSYSQLGMFLKDRHRPQEAEAAFHQVLQLREKLIVDFPKEPEYRAQLSHWYVEWAYMLKDTEPREAEKGYRQAIAIQEKLAADYPDVVEYRRTLANRYNENLPPGSLGEFLFYAGRMQESAAAARKSLEILNELPAGGAGERANTAHRLRLLAFRLWSLGKRPESEKLLREAVVVFQKLAAEVPDEMHFPCFQAGSLEYIGKLLANTQPEASKKAYQEALEVYDKMIAKFSPETGRPQMLDVHHRHMVGGAHRQRVRILQTLGRFAEAEEGHRQAITAYAKAAADSPTVPEFREDLASFHFGLSDFLKGADRRKQAEEEYRKGVAIYEKLAADFSQLPNYRKELADRVGVLGNLLKANGQPAEALKCHQQAVDIRRKLATEYPKDPSYRKDLAYHYGRLGDMLQANKQSSEAEQAFRQSVDVLEKLVAEFPNAVGYRRELASAYKKTGQKTKTLAELTKVIELEPLNPAAWNLRGISYAQFGQFDKAVSDHAKALELAPQNAGWHNNLAWFLATCPEPKFRDAGRAVNLAKKAVELTPKDGMYWNTLGVAVYRGGDWKSAITALAKAMQLRKGGDSFDWFFLAMAHRQLDEKDEARKWYERAVEWMEKHQPNNEELRRFRAEAEALLEVKKK